MIDHEENTAPQELGSEQIAESSTPRVDLTEFAEYTERIKQEFSKVLIGNEHLVELLYASLLCQGHVLLEGVPGLAKTLSAKVMARTLQADFTRIQFTPDLMPSDIIGTSIFSQQSSAFEFQQGPIFSNIVLIDEINRAPAKTQAALFEVMEEHQVSFDGVRYEMEFPFFVIATQNPIEQEGTYRLPEAQLDRFLMKIKLQYPNPTEELEILNRYKNNVKDRDLSIINKVLKPKALKKMQILLNEIHVEPQILQYIVDLIQETRQNVKVYFGASPRASLALLSTSRALAAIRGRDFVLPDDVQAMAPHVLNHRIILTPETEMQGESTKAVIQEIIDIVELPR